MVDKHDLWFAWNVYWLSAFVITLVVGITKHLSPWHGMALYITLTTPALVVVMILEKRIKKLEGVV